MNRRAAASLAKGRGEGGGSPVVGVGGRLMARAVLDGDDGVGLVVAGGAIRGGARRHALHDQREMGPPTPSVGGSNAPDRPAPTGARPSSGLAERVGFEPTDLSISGFQDRPVRPLRHLSARRADIRRNDDPSIHRPLGRPNTTTRHPRPARGESAYWMNWPAGPDGLMTALRTLHGIVILGVPSA